MKNKAKGKKISKHKKAHFSTKEYLKTFWDDPKNEDKTIYFVALLGEGSDIKDYAVGIQNKMWYNSEEGFDYEHVYDTIEEAVISAQAEAIKDKDSVYLENPKVIKGENARVKY